MYSILIADDETIITNGIKNLIESACPELVIKGVFNDGKALLEALKKSPPDIVITDICMPVESGMSVAEYVYKEHLSTRVIFISGYQHFEYAKQALSYHISSYVVKPFKSSQLIEAIKNAESEIDAIMQTFRSDSEKKCIEWENTRYALNALNYKIKNGDFGEITDNIYTGLDVSDYRFCLITLMTESEVNLTEAFERRIKDLTDFDGDSVKAVYLSDMTVYLFYKDQTDLKQYQEYLNKSLQLFFDFKMSNNFEYFDSFLDFCRSFGLKKNNEELTFVENIKMYIQDNLNSNMGVESIADYFNVTTTHIGRVFRNETGVKLVDFIISERIKKAKKLLLDHTLSLEKVSETVGYTSLRYFNSLFKKSEGVSMREYRNTHMR